ncbi:MAG: peptidylprolyl isomerase, partial [Candidatus Sumerlaeia bacterium]|nr:peptidylprolyl isomerase [Candidatus Sumerlaeia bacterium]
DSVVAIVGSEPITLLQVKRYWLVSVLAAEREKFSLSLPQETLRSTLELLIEDRLLLKLGEEKDIKLNESEIEEVIQKKWEWIAPRIENNSELKQLVADLGLKPDDIKTLLRERERADFLLAQLLLPRLNITQTELDKYIEQLSRDKKPLTTYRLSQIYLPFTPANKESQIKLAYEILQQLESGASFAKLAQKYSAETAGIAGGDLGYLDAGQIDPQVESAIKDLPAGKIAGPIISESASGGKIHILKITDKITPRDKLLRDKYHREKDLLFKQLKQKNTIISFL